MHGLGIIERPSRPSDVQVLALRRIKNPYPIPAPILEVCPDHSEALQRPPFHVLTINLPLVLIQLTIQKCSPLHGLD